MSKIVGQVVSPFLRVQGRHIVAATVEGNAFNQTPIDFATATDTAPLFVFNYTLADTASFVDSASIVWTIAREFADSASISESPTLSFSTPATDSSTASDTDLVLSLGLAKADSAAASESLVQAISKALSDAATANDLLGVTDGITYTIAMTEADTVSISESPSLVWTIARTFVDSSSPTDSTPVFTISRSIGDSAQVNDLLTDSGDSSFVLDFTFGRSLDDFAYPIDSGAVLSIGLAPSETLTASEGVDSFDIGKVVGDTSTVTESPAIAFTQGNIGDSVSATESIIVGFGFEETAADSTSATDSPALTPSKVFGDSASTSEVAVLAPNLGPGDSVTATESLVFAIAQVLADSASATEAKQFAIPLVFNDSSSALDSGQGVRRDYFDSDYVVEPPSADSAFDADSSFTFT